MAGSLILDVSEQITAFIFMCRAQHSRTLNIKAVHISETSGIKQACQSALQTQKCVEM
jgi:hypothetical protein